MLIARVGRRASRSSSTPRTFGASTAAALLLTPRPFERRPGRSAWRDVREGFAFVRARTWLWATLAIAGLLNVAPAARNVLLPFVVKNDLHASAAALGAVYSATAAGALVSALAYGQRGLPRRFVLVMYVGWAGATFVIAGYGLATGVWQMVVLGFVAGLGTRARPGDLGDDDAPPRPARAARARDEPRLAALDEPDAACR